MDGPIILRRLAAPMRSCAIQAAPIRNLDGGGIAVVLTLLGRTITNGNALIQPVYVKVTHCQCT